MRTEGKKPLDSGGPMNNVIKPAAIRAGITKRVHWHAFRYTYGTWLLSKGVDIRNVHELMRHASPRTTLEFYVKARKKLKRAAQEKIEKLLFPGVDDSEISFEDSDVPAHVREEQKRDALEHIASMIFGGEDSEALSKPHEARIDDNEDYLM
jgi:hypothetical protein